MRAAICRQFGQPLVIEEIAIAAPGPGEVLVDVKACAICHSDISFADGAWGGALPAVYGHEAAGVIRSAGPGAGRLRAGDHVAVTLIRSCGQCHYCAQGSSVLCEEVFDLDRASPLSGADGTAYHQAMRTGAFAEQVLVHHSQVVTIDKDISFTSACLLACGVITGYGAVTRTAALRAGQHVAVIGCGGVGLNSIQAASIAGASTVIAIDLSREKLEAARDFGATDAIDPAQEDAPARVMALTRGRGVDFVFVTVGARAAIESAADLITRNGTIVVVGMPATGTRAEFDPGMLAAWNQSIIGSKMGQADIARDIPALLALYRAGRLKLDELVTGCYRLDEINDAIAAVKAGKALRNVIVFD